MDKICIAFAGCVGSSKTPISNYLSPKFGLPIFNNDAIRSEVIEDIGFFDPEEHLKRRNDRLEEVLKSGISFIADVSVDREWGKFKEKLSSNGYKRFIISMDLSEELLIKLYKAKGYNDSLERLNELLQDHENFIKDYGNDIGVNIKDNDFENRLKIAYEAVKVWLEKAV